MSYSISTGRMRVRTIYTYKNEPNNWHKFVQYLLFHGQGPSTFYLIGLKRFCCHGGPDLRSVETSYPSLAARGDTNAIV